MELLGQLSLKDLSMMSKEELQQLADELEGKIPGKTSELENDSTFQTFVKDETMTEIASAIRSKLGSTEHYLPKDIPEAVMKISGSGGSGSERDPIRFYDYDGTFLYGFSFEEIQEMAVNGNVLKRVENLSIVRFIISIRSLAIM